jgi:hypothetical protein
MNRNKRNVILQAPLGVGCVVMVLPQGRAGFVESARSDATRGRSGKATDILAGRLFLLPPSDALRTKAKSDHDRVAITYEAVISGCGVGMLGDNHGDLHG